MTSLSLADAREIIAAGESKAEEIEQPSNIAVVDAGGNLIAHVRMDGAWLGSIDISINKAFTARGLASQRAILRCSSSTPQPTTDSWCRPR